MKSLNDYAHHGIKVKDKHNSLHSLMSKHHGAKIGHQTFTLDTNISIPKVDRRTVPEHTVSERGKPHGAAAHIPVRPATHSNAREPERGHNKPVGLGPMKGARK